MNVSSISPASNQFSRLVQRTSLGGVIQPQERVTVRIEPTASQLEVVFYNHGTEAQPRNDEDSLIALVLPADGDGEAFVDEFLAAYQAPPDFMTALFGGWSVAVLRAHQAKPSDELHAKAAARLREEGVIGEDAPHAEYDDGDDQTLN